MGTELALRPRPVARRTDRRGHVEDDGDGQSVVFLGQRYERAARLDLHVGRVNDREASSLETFAGNEVEDLKGCTRGGLVILVV